MKEIWKDIKGYEGLYQVSNKGTVKSLNYHQTGEERIKKPKINRGGYLQVMLHRDGNRKTLLVHRLVLMTFAPIDNMSALQVNHKDEDKTNNKLENLEWCNSKYNNNYGTRTQRTEKPVVQLDRNSNEIVNVFNSAREAKRQGFNPGNITRCCKNKFNRPGNNIYKGYKWMYLSDYIKSIDTRITKVILFDKVS